MRIERRDVWAWGAALFAIAALFCLPLLGKTTFSPDVWARFPQSGATLADLDFAAKIFWGERFPKTALAMLAGAGLALAGLTTQTLFRNELATPHTLGVSSGAAFGATLAIQFSDALLALGIPLYFLGAPQVVWGALAGAV
ncbi:MAG: iron chelate uptake ABC transporter family permease subunit, partial [Thermoguttaceae bacterium]|nr:iron chelate uptake ABC transporter family permease subunit [Thermoguttaceae bacterium]